MFEYLKSAATPSNLIHQFEYNISCRDNYELQHEFPTAYMPDNQFKYHPCADSIQNSVLLAKWIETSVPNQEASTNKTELYVPYWIVLILRNLRVDIKSGVGLTINVFIESI